MKKYGTYTLLILLLIHVFLLYCYGISTFLTTCLCYYFIYIFFRFVCGLIKNKEWKDLVIVNLRNILLILVAIEFIMTFIPPFNFLNNYMERDRGVYFSEYKRKTQCILLQKLGFDKARFIFEDGNLPDSKRRVNRGEYSFIHTYNELGLRGKLPRLQKSTNEIRIVLLGDSFIEGDGTPDDSTISVLLEQKLNAENTRYKFSVINGGISGSNPIYELQFLRNKLMRFNPDMIVASVFSNDLWDIHVMRHQNTLPLEEYPFAISHIFRLFYFGIMKYNDFSCLNPPQRTKKLRETLLHYLQDDLMIAQKQFKNQGIDMLTMYIPTKEEVMNRNVFLAQKQHISGSIKYDVNILKQFDVNGNNQKSKLPGRYYWNNDAHFRPAGYNLVATILSEKIKQIDWKNRNTTISESNDKSN